MVKGFPPSSQHVPVLLSAVLDFAKDSLCKPGSVYLDGTFGMGGHCEAIVNRYKPFLKKVYVVDLDLWAIERAHEFCQQNLSVEVYHGGYDQIPPYWGPFDFILLDLGVSSPQLDHSNRGFSFYIDGPLDMRFNQASELTAADVVNHYDENKLFEIFKNYGEIRNPWPVVKAIIKQRQRKRFERTLELAKLIEKVQGWRIKGFHPATLFFQALRMEVNQELQRLEKALDDLPYRLNLNGRLCVISFHSLEDRVVKHRLKQLNQLKPVNKKVIIPDREEIKSNPRSRSAKLRCYQRVT